MDQSPAHDLIEAGKLESTAGEEQADPAIVSEANDGTEDGVPATTTAAEAASVEEEASTAAAVAEGALVSSLVELSD